MRVVTSALVLFSLLFVVAQTAPQVAPTTTGDLVGTVRDNAGNPIAGATLSLVQNGVVQRTTVTDGRGQFSFRGAPAGRYDLTIDASGFSPVRRPVSVAAGRNPALTFVLQPAQVQAPKTQPPAEVAQERTASAAKVDSALGGMVVPTPRSRPYAIAGPRPDFNTEAYDRIHENGFRRVADHPLSTFSIDVDTASYSNVRRFLEDGKLPPADAVRIEELINYFRFDYPQPAGDAPFSVTTEIATAPWNSKHRLALVGLQGRRMSEEKTPPRNLVFLLDVSGSMMPANKLPLVKTAMRMFVDTLTERDRVGIVVYAGASGVVLPMTKGSDKVRILGALEALDAGGSTNGAAGIHAAYDLASSAFIKEGINRVILATDGDFNVGVTSQGELLRLIEEKRATGIFLSVLGVGEGNLKDSTMEKLADAGNGNYSYLDTLHEARRVLVEEAGSTLVTIAKDVKLQVEFNPKAVGMYRLIGYENRVLQNEDFNNDKKDAGDIGAGHSVTVLYEIVPPGVDVEGTGHVDPLKYQTAPRDTNAATGDELMTVKLRYKAPDGDVSRPMSIRVANRTTSSPTNLRFAASVAAFGMVLRRSDHRGSASYTQALELARANRGGDPRGYRAEFIRLIELASALDRSDKHDEIKPLTR